MRISKEHTCCFFGHRKISETEALRDELNNEIEMLIVEENVDTFLFGSKSQFNDLSYNVVTKLKEKFRHIKRVYVRSAYADVNDEYVNYLLENYEETYYPEKIRRAGRASYIERNREMVEMSKFCVVYFDENYITPMDKNGNRPKSGTALAYDFAVKMNRKIINVCPICR